MSKANDKLRDAAIPMPRRDDPTDPKLRTDVPDPVETPQRIRARRTVFWWVLALFIVVGALALITAPFAEAYGNAELWTLVLAPIIAILMVASLGWLTLYVLRRPRKDAPRGPRG